MSFYPEKMGSILQRAAVMLAIGASRAGSLQHRPSWMHRETKKCYSLKLAVARTIAARSRYVHAIYFFITIEDF